MFYLIFLIFVLGYIAIALEHPFKVDKAATALIIGVLCWTVYILDVEHILQLGFSPTWETLVSKGRDILNLVKPSMTTSQWVNSEWPETIATIKEPYRFVIQELEHHLIDISEILFFLLGAMTIVEIVDQHDGFRVITDKITTTNKVKLLWIISIITFFMSPILDNLTTTIVMTALLRKLIDDQKTRWFFVAIVVLAANSGGAWSPIGDVTTIMLWIGAQITAVNIIAKVFLPSMVSVLVPLTVISFTMKGVVKRPQQFAHENTSLPSHEQIIILCTGVGALLFVPVFKGITHLPPYMGMIFGLGVIWIVTEIMHKSKPIELKRKLSVINILRRIETTTVFFSSGF